MMTALLLTFTGSAVADNLTVSDVEIKAGETVDVAIGLNNPNKKYAAFQFDLVLPEGVSIAKNSKDKLIASLNAERMDDHTLNVSDMGSNTYRFLSFSMTNAEFYGTSGTLVNVTLVADGNLGTGRKTATITSQVFTEVGGDQAKWDDVTFSINVVPAVVPEIRADDKNREYGEDNPALTYTVSAEIKGSPRLSTTATKTSPVGEYDIVVDRGTVEGDYTAVNGKLTVTKAPLKVKAKDYTINQGEALPAFEAVYEGFKNNETESVLTKKPVFSTTATSDSEPGTYEIKAGNAEAKNYDISYVNGTLTIKAGKFRLIYMVDGEVYKTYEIEYGKTITPEAAPTKEGYTFSGWSEIPQTMPAKDVTVTGTFTVNKYKLTYMVDGAEYKSYEIEYGAKITPETEPIKEGYSFSGWSSIPEIMPAKDVVVTGTFSKGSYKLTYMVDGAVYKTVSYDYGDRITPEAAPTKEGYTFSGWSNIPATMPAKDVTVTGTFTINKYKLTYKVDGEIYKTYEIEYGKAITPEAEPTKEGYTFSGWNEIPSTMPAHDVEVMGTFIQVEFVIDDVTYEISGEGTVTIKGSDQKGEVTIDATVVINGQTYRVTAIADNAFKENQSITSVTIPEGITTIGDNAFNGCINLIVINIGKDVQSIGNKAFANVGTASAARTRSEESMLIVNCYAESVPQTASDAFENTPIENGTLMVEDNSVNAYKATSPWSRFGRIMGFDEAAGINTISFDSVNARIYDMQGNRLDNLQKGVNIIRYKDGKVKKVMVK